MHSVVSAQLHILTRNLVPNLHIGTEGLESMDWGCRDSTCYSVSEEMIEVFDAFTRCLVSLH